MAPFDGALIGVVLLGLMAVEWALLRARLGAYFRLGLPLGAEPLPLDAPPTEAGETPTVRWTSDGPLARYWSRDAGRPGLHGEVRLIPQRGRHRLAVRWAPPWSLLVLAGALAFLGPAAALVAIAFVIGVLALYQQAAVRAAAELRFHWAEAPRRPGS